MKSRVRYQTLEFGDVDIHLRTLRNRNEYWDDDGAAERAGISSAAWPMFGVVWPSGEVLAQHMLDFPIDGLRILEVGCGIGLASLLLKTRNANITATDHHPAAEGFLKANTALNDLAAIPFFQQSWDDSANRMGEFDLIIGSDLLYERGHADLLSGFIHSHARASCRVLIVDPDRREQARFRQHMIALGYSYSASVADVPACLSGRFKGRIMSFAIEPLSEAG